MGENVSQGRRAEDRANETRVSAIGPSAETVETARMSVLGRLPTFPLHLEGCHSGEQMASDEIGVSL